MVQSALQQIDRRYREPSAVIPVTNSFGIATIRCIFAKAHPDRIPRQPQDCRCKLRLLIGDRKRAGDHAGVADGIPVELSPCPLRSSPLALVLPQSLSQTLG